MKLSDYIEILKPEVVKLFKNDNSGHDISHLERTMKIALELQKHEGGDKTIIGISAFLHDVHRIMQNETKEFVSPKNSLPTILNILQKTNLSQQQINSILHCIEFHEEYNWNNKDNSKQNIETKILQDADNLDAIGAIGVVRAFSYGSAHNIPIYDESIPLKTRADFKEENGDEESTVHHFYHKLFKLGDYMNTKTAKIMAKERVDFMKTFIKVLINEWNGKFN